MADQATVSGGDGARLGAAPVEDMVGNITEFGNDLATLAELQARLTVIDLKECAGRALVPAGALAGGLALLLASLPVALIGAAELLASALDLRQRGWAYLIVAGIALASAVLISAVAGSRLGRSFEAFRRSREEFARNIAWLRTVLLHSGRATPRQQRR